jgi:hypothetical protein
VAVRDSLVWVAATWPSHRIDRFVSGNEPAAISFKFEASCFWQTTTGIPRDPINRSGRGLLILRDCGRAPDRFTVPIPRHKHDPDSFFRFTWGAQDPRRPLAGTG